jgi:hypothetical protein
VSKSNELPHTQATPAVPPRLAEPRPAESRPDEPKPDEMASDDHGRPLTTNAAAAAWYRVAQRSLVHRDGPDPALRRALQADPTFAVAASDLRALADESPGVEPARPSTTWERHHCEIVTEARCDVGRASGILREHLADVVCDPLAVHVVSTVLRDASCHDTARSADLADLLASTPDCHPPATVTPRP